MGWIKTSDRMPEDGVNVLVASRDNLIVTTAQVAVRPDRMKWWLGAAGEWCRELGYFSEWQPLPSNPRADS